MMRPRVTSIFISHRVATSWEDALFMLHMIIRASILWKAPKFSLLFYFVSFSKLPKAPHFRSYIWKGLSWKVTGVKPNDFSNLHLSGELSVPIWSSEALASRSQQISCRDSSRLVSSRHGMHRGGEEQWPAGSSVRRKICPTQNHVCVWTVQTSEQDAGPVLRFRTPDWTRTFKSKRIPKTL
jgi:hypothetical protein